MDLGETGEALNVSLILHQKSREKWKVSHPMALSFFFFFFRKNTPLKSQQLGLPGWSAGKTPSSECRKPRFDPWSRNYMLHALTKDSVCHN